MKPANKLFFKITNPSYKIDPLRIPNPNGSSTSSTHAYIKTREECGHGRIEIEEARLFDKQGDHATSSEKYEATATFQKIAQADSEQTRKEVMGFVFGVG